MEEKYIVIFTTLWLNIALLFFMKDFILEVNRMCKKAFIDDMKMSNKNIESALSSMLTIFALSPFALSYFLILRSLYFYIAY